MAEPGTRERRRLAGLLRGTDLAWAYAAVVVVVAIGVRVLPGTRPGDLVLDTSTNLDNLRHTPLLVLGASAFVVAPVWGCGSWCRWWRCSGRRSAGSAGPRL